ncbi:MAG: OmpA family protein [Bacteroidia bacterium]|nr:OmpA family protein [Bacteroidia bacterium]
MNKAIILLVFSYVYLAIAQPQVADRYSGGGSERYSYKEKGSLKRENVGHAINTEFDESAPVISADGKTLYFWSMGRPDGYGIQDIYVSKQDSTGNWQPAVNIGPPLNNAECNFVMSVTPDGTKLLLYQKSKKAGGSDLAISRRGTFSWGYPEQLKFEKYTNKAESSISADLGADGKTLILSIEGEDSKGAEDLYVSFFDKEKKVWTTPKNMGNINTTGSESTPFLAQDNITLYYSTNGNGGFGGDDIFMSRRLDDTWANWSKPVNLGQTINTQGDDYYFKFSAKADYAYLVSTDSSIGLKDIFRVPIPAEFRPKPVFLVSGHVRDKKTNKPIQANITYSYLPEGIEIGSASTSSDSGDYQIILPAGKLYAFQAEAPGYYAVSENLNGAGLISYKLTERDLYLVPLEIGGIIELKNLFFPTNSFSLLPNSIPELERLYNLMKITPNLTIEIMGHTDNVGDANTNQTLSENRAKTVVEWLFQKGVEPNRVTSAGYGSTQPVAPNDSEINRQKNRRVEIKITNL